VVTLRGYGTEPVDATRRVHQTGLVYLTPRATLQMVNLTLTYFPGKGRASAARLALRIGGIEFVDEHISFEDWPKKSQQDDYPMGQVPVLKVDDKVICQTHAITYYCGTLAGLVPKDDWGKAKVLELLGCIDDTVALILPSLMEKDMEKKLREREVLVKGPLREAVTRLEKLIAANGHPGYSVGDALTVVDVSFLQIVSWLTSGTLDGIPKDFVTTEKYPALVAVSDKVLSVPNVKEWHLAEVD